MKTSTKTKIVIGELPSAGTTQLAALNHSELCAVIGGKGTPIKRPPNSALICDRRGCRYVSLVNGRVPFN